tara:strand:+ start:3286 stop:4323 length:1038 start_codon:yes stop_codon:yes gene_type:complete
MTFYFFYFFYCSFHIFFEFINSKKLSNIILLYLSIITLIFFSLRDVVGGDWYQYIDMINQTENLLPLQSDPGFNLILFLFNKFQLDYYTFNFVISAFFLFGNYFFLKQFHNKFTIWVFYTPYFYFIVSIGYLRQAIAISLILLSLYLIHKLKFKLSFIVFLLSSLFHSTSIVLLPIYFLNYIKNNKLNSVSIYLILSLIFFSSIYITINYSSIYFRIISYILIPEVTSSGSIYRIPIILIPSLLILYIFDFNKISKNLIIYKYYSVYAIILLPTYFLSSTLIDRLYLYFYPLLAFFINHFINSLIESRNKIIIKIIFFIISLILLYIWLYFADNRSGWIPFKLII